jgi:hypothetical protein
MRTTASTEPPLATADASASRPQAVTSSTAAAAIAMAPTGCLSMRRSTRMRANTGNAVIDMATPMKSAKDTNDVCGANSSYSGRATAMPSPIGTAMLACEMSAACSKRSRSSFGSSSRPTRNM